MAWLFYERLSAFISGLKRSVRKQLHSGAAPDHADPALTFFFPPSSLPSMAKAAFIAAMPVTADLFPELFTPFTNTTVFTEATIDPLTRILVVKYAGARQYTGNSSQSNL
jgi:hypothetical protein